MAIVARPDTILTWHRRLVARKLDRSRGPRTPGRPRIDREVEALIIRIAEENRCWNCRGARQSGPQGFRSNGGQCSASSWHTTGTGAQAHDHVGGIYSDPPRVLV